MLNANMVSTIKVQHIQERDIPNDKEHHGDGFFFRFVDDGLQFRLLSKPIEYKA